MKYKDKKDEKLNELFSKYMEEEEQPAENVTAAAKEELARRSAERVPAEVPVVLSAGGASRPRGGNILQRIPYTVYIAVAALFMIAAAVLLALLLRSGSMGSVLSTDDSLSSGSDGAVIFGVGGDEIALDLNSDDSSAGQAMAPDGMFFFVEEDVSCIYSRYVLTEGVGPYSAGQTVVYRLDCTVPPGVGAVIYVEEEGVRFEDLLGYKALPEQREVDGEMFELGREGGNTLIYFTCGGYGYNISVSTEDDAEVNALLGNISGAMQ